MSISFEASSPLNANMPSIINIAGAEASGSGSSTTAASSSVQYIASTSWGEGSSIPANQLSSQQQQPVLLQPHQQPPAAGSLVPTSPMSQQGVLNVPAFSPPPTGVIPTDSLSPRQMQHQPQQTPSSEGLNLFVAGLPSATTADDLTKLFEPYGTIDSTKVMLDTKTGASRGFGFVHFKSSDEAVKAMNALSNSPYGSGRLFISISQHDGKVQESQRLYIRNIPLGVPPDDIKKYFSQFGVMTMFVVRQGEGSFGADGSRQIQQLTLQYTRLEDAKKAYASCHGATPFPGSQLPIIAKYSEVTHRSVAKKNKQNKQRMKGQQAGKQPEESPQDGDSQHSSDVMHHQVPPEQGLSAIPPTFVPQPSPQPDFTLQQGQGLQQQMVLPSMLPPHNTVAVQQQHVVAQGTAPPPHFVVAPSTGFSAQPPPTSTMLTFQQPQPQGQVGHSIGILGSGFAPPQPHMVHAGVPPPPSARIMYPPPATTAQPPVYFPQTSGQQQVWPQ